MTNDRMTETINQAIMVIHENFGERLTVEDMARAATYSRFHFSRQFQQVTGITPGRFLARVRIQEAKRLLISTPLSVTEIAERVGYSSIGSFSNTFKSSVGLSPREYRRSGLQTKVPAAPRRRQGRTSK